MHFVNSEINSKYMKNLVVHVLMVPFPTGFIRK